MDPNGETPAHVIAAGVGAAIGFISSYASQKFSGDGNVNWSTVAAATVSGAVIGLTAGLAAPEVAALGFTGVQAATVVGLQTAPAALVGGTITQMVENSANGDPIEQGALKAGIIGAVGTVFGGVAGDKIVRSLTSSNIAGNTGKLVGGQATGDFIEGTVQEAATQGASSACSGEKCD